MLTVAYCRVSTDVQAEEGFSIEGQAAPTNKGGFGFRTDVVRCGTVHLRGALRVLVSGCFATPVFLKERDFCEF